MGLTEADVVAACNAWVWWPDNAEVIETAEYTLVRFPAWFESELVLLRFQPQRETSEVLAEVLAHASSTGLDDLVFWVKLGAPDRLEEMLAHLGGRPEETLDVLAVDLTPGAPDLGSRELDVRWVDDVDVLRDSYAVGTAVFGGDPPPDDRLELETLQTGADHDQGNGGVVVAYADGLPIDTGGASLVHGVARLWGGCVVERARGRGAYRAVLAERLSYSVGHGCTLGLVKGRVQTSGPILRRAGFEAYGQERSYRIRLS